MYPGLVLYPELILVSQGINSFLRVWFLYPRIVFFKQGCFLYLRVCSCIPGLVFVAQKGFCFFTFPLLLLLLFPSYLFLLLLSFFNLLLNYRKVPFFQHYSLDWLKLKFESNSFLFIPKFNGFHYIYYSLVSNACIHLPKFFQYFIWPSIEELFFDKNKSFYFIANSIIEYNPCQYPSFYFIDSF